MSIIIGFNTENGKGNGGYMSIEDLACLIKLNNIFTLGKGKKSILENLDNCLHSEDEDYVRNFCDDEREVRSLAIRFRGMSEEEVIEVQNAFEKAKDFLDIFEFCNADFTVNDLFYRLRLKDSKNGRDDSWMDALDDM